MLDQITPLIVSYNEAANIRRTLTKLTWAQRIVVIDSGSTDETLKILDEYSNVDVIHQAFTDFASQCNFGLSQISTPWVLSLDADYELSDDFVHELSKLVPCATVGYRARFIYRIYGRPLHGTLYPPRIVLYQKAGARYRNEGHGHRVSITGDVMDMKGIIYHDDRKPLSRWISSQQLYARQEANYLFSCPRDKLSRTDVVRLMGWPAPILIPIYTLFVKGCVLDGWAGWHYTMQRLLFETLTALEIVELKIRGQTVQNR